MLTRAFIMQTAALQANQDAAFWAIVSTMKI